MMFPWQMTARLSGYLASNKIRGRKRFPYVLMLEPLFRCNLECAGCGRIREFGDQIDRTLNLEQCLEAVDEAGAPVVSLTGGEPLIHPQIGEIVAGIVGRQKFLNLCTNGLLLERSLAKMRPSPYFSFVVHLDGLAGTHDRNANRRGVFDTAVEGIRAAKAAGFQVRTNTTIYRNSDLDEIQRLFDMLTGMHVNGVMVSPAFGFGAVESDIFLTRGEANQIFRRLGAQRQVPYCNTPGYWDFLSGQIELSCTPWSCPTRNPIGWKRPCYLITDGHCESFAELLDETDWSQYGTGNDPRCANCMLHSGYEASAIDAAGQSPRRMLEMLRWSFSGTAS